MSKKILFTSGEGVGNVMQCAPVLRTMKEVLDYDIIDFWFAFGAYPITANLFPYVNRWLVGNQLNYINIKDYEGVTATHWTRDYVRQIPLPLLNKITLLSPNRSEVDSYMDIARDLGVKEEEILWQAECTYKKVDDKYDIVLNDGYKKIGAGNWGRKGYPHYKEVAELLKAEGFSVCSVGSKTEWIEGTENKTGLPLLYSLGVIKNSKLSVCNDSGLYHCANGLKKTNVAVFTATSTKKNFDPRFHQYTNIMTRDDLECRPCQNTPRWKTCTSFECRNIDPEIIVNFILEKLNG